MDYKIFDSLQDTVCVVNEQMELFYGNNAAALLLEVSAKRLRGGKPLSQFLEFSGELLESGTLAQVEDPSPYREVRFTTPNGKEGWVQISLQRDPDTPTEGTERRWILYVRDVSLERTLHDKYKAELDQKEAVIEDLRKAQAQLEDYSKNLEKMVEQRTAELREANRLMAAILDSLSQGIFVFDSKGQCLPFYSKVCESILEKSPKEKKAAEVLGLAGDAVTSFSQWLQTLYDDILPFEDMAPLGPTRYIHSQGRHIEVSYNPMRDTSQKLAGVVAVATDRTSEIRAKQEAERERAFANMIVKITSHRSQFRAFACEAQQIFVDLATHLKQDQKINVELTARLLHTIKGGAASFGLHDLAQISHRSEEKLAELKNNTDERSVTQSLLSATQEMVGIFTAFMEQHAALIGRIEDTGRQVEVAIPALIQWHESLSNPDQVSKVRQDIYDSYILEPVQKSFAHLDASLQELANSLGKKIHPLEFLNGDLRIVPESLQPLFATLIHIFRNAVDHGMETPEVRLEAGKPELGTLTVEFSREQKESKTWLKLVIRDDGGGIDPQKIRARLQQLGRYAAYEKLSDLEVIQVIFSDDFSTRTEVTEVSGRGVGLNAVRDAAEKMGGTVTVTSQIGKGSCFEICVPEAHRQILARAA